MNTPGSQAQLTEATDRLDRLQGRILDQMKSFAEPHAPYSSIAKAYLQHFKARIAALPSP